MLLWLGLNTKIHVTEKKNFVRNCCFSQYLALQWYLKSFLDQTMSEIVDWGVVPCSTCFRLCNLRQSYINFHVVFYFSLSKPFVNKMYFQTAERKLELWEFNFIKNKSPFWNFNQRRNVWDHSIGQGCGAYPMKKLVTNNI